MKNISIITRTGRHSRQSVRKCLQSVAAVSVLVFTCGNLSADVITHNTTADFIKGSYTTMGTSVTKTDSITLKTQLKRMSSFSNHQLGGAGVTQVFGMAMVEYNDNLYYFGGNAARSGNSDSVTAVAKAVIPNGFTIPSFSAQSNSLPQARAYHAAAVWNGFLYVAGGAANTQDDPVSTVFISSIQSNGSVGVWSAANQSLPKALKKHSLAAWNGRLYLLGGQDKDGNEQTDIYRAELNRTTGEILSWTKEQTSLPAGFVQAKVWNGTLYAVFNDTVRRAPIQNNGRVGAWGDAQGSFNNANSIFVADGRVYLSTGNLAAESGDIQTFYTAPVTDGNLVWESIGNSSSINQTKLIRSFIPWVTKGKWFALFTNGKSPTDANFTSFNIDFPADTSFVNINNYAGGGALVVNNRLYVSGFGLQPNSVMRSAPLVNGVLGVWRDESASNFNVNGQVSMANLNGRMYKLRTDTTNNFEISDIGPNGVLGTWEAGNEDFPEGNQPFETGTRNNRYLFVANGYLFASYTVDSTHYNISRAALDGNGRVTSWTKSAGITAENFTVARTMALGNAKQIYIVKPQFNTIWVYTVADDGSVSLLETRDNPDVGTFSIPSLAVLNNKLYAFGSNATQDTRIHSAPLLPDGKFGAPLTREAITAAFLRGNNELFTDNNFLYHMPYASTSNIYRYEPEIPMAPGGNYYSPVIDLGAARNIQKVEWVQDALPAGSSIKVYTAAGLTNSTTNVEFVERQNGADINVNGRYVQYRVDLTRGTDASLTPSLKSISITHRAPSTLSASVQNTKTIRWHWTDYPNAQNYQIRDSGNNVLSGNLNGNLSQWVEINLEPNTLYTRGLWVSDDGVNHIFQSSVAARTVSNTKLKSVPLSNSSIRWEWTAGSEEATGFKVTDGDDNVKSPVLSTVTFAWVETGLLPNTTYMRKLVEINANGNLFLSQEIGRTKPADKNDAPDTTALRTGIISNNSIQWNWSLYPNASYYSLTDESGVSKSGDLTSDVLSWTESGLSPNQHVTRKIVVQTETDLVHQRRVSARTLLNEPSGLALSNAGGRNLTLTWDANGNSGTPIYEISAAANGTDNFNVIVPFARELKETTFVRGGLVSNVQYKFRVRAGNPDSTVSGYSTEVSTTFPVSKVGSNGAEVSLPHGKANIQGPGVTQEYLEDGRVKLICKGSATIEFSNGAAVRSRESHQNVNIIQNADGLVVTSSESMPVTISGVEAKASSGTLSVIIRNNALDFSLTADDAAQNIQTGFVPNSDKSIQMELINAGRNIKVNLPASAFTQQVGVTLQIPQRYPASVASQGGQSVIPLNLGLEVNLDQPVQPGVEVPLTLGYQTADLAGTREELLQVVRYDPDKDIWIPMRTTVDSANKSITGYTNHFSLFRVVSKTAAANVNECAVYPNPLRPHLGHTQMSFDNLNENASVKIYTYLGELVRELKANAQGLALWDGRNRGNEWVGSGGYIALIEGADNSKKSIVIGVER